ncbi:hypothetical protein HOY80DRAFT_331664 [Tuber brumale]|nr:hypothetical protein HOY80DRAFT_331664 [Tuber brumale]
MASSLSPGPLTPYRLRHSTTTTTNTTNLTPTSTTSLLLPRHSPSSVLHLHHSEDPLIFQIGTRNLQAGYPSEPHPRCILPWTNPEFWKRSGDLWGLGGWYSPTGTSSTSRGELWHNAETIEDVLERGVRVAYNKYLLLDSKTRRIVLLVKTEVDVGVLSKVVKSLFVHFQMPAVMLMQEPVMAVVGAGVRSGVVLDVGWSEAVINIVYEMRVVGPGKRSRRGGRTYRDFWRKFLQEEYFSSASSNEDNDNNNDNGTSEDNEIADWEVEEILTRTGWCQSSSPPSRHQDETTITIPLTTPTLPKTLTFPFNKLATPAEKTFFATTTTDSPTPEYPDDDDYALPELVYRALRDCPIDVRAAVMQRIIITGGGSYVPGLKKRVIDEVHVLVKCRGWERVGRRAVKTGKGGVPAGEERVEEGYQWRREATASPEGQKGGDTGGRGRIAGVESFGSWVGASLVAGMKVRGTVEVEREKFLAAVVAGGTGFPLDV